MNVALRGWAGRGYDGRKRASMSWSSRTCSSISWSQSTSFGGMWRPLAMRTVMAGYTWSYGVVGTRAEMFAPGWPTPPGERPLA